MDAKAIRTAIGTVLASLAVGAAILTGTPGTALAEPAGETPLYYLENRFTGEAMFTISKVERDTMRSNGWTYVKVSLLLPTESESPVYRLYNPYEDNHIFTQDPNEYAVLGERGWNQEGVQFYSDDAETVAMYRLYSLAGNGGTYHIYTTTRSYYDQLIAAGEWSGDGARWYGYRIPTAAYEQFQGLTYPDIDYTDSGEVIQPTEPTPPAANDGDESDEGRQDVLTYAREWIGWPYVSYGESPEEGGFDCSGLTQWVFSHFGVDLPRTTWDQISWLQDHGTWTSDVTQLKPGDLVAMSGGGHVGIFVGLDPETGRYMMIDAPHPGEPVQEREIYSIYYGGFMGGGSVL